VCECVCVWMQDRSKLRGVLFIANRSSRWWIFIFIHTYTYTHIYMYIYAHRVRIYVYTHNKRIMYCQSLCQVIRKYVHARTHMCVYKCICTLPLMPNAHSDYAYVHSYMHLNIYINMNISIHAQISCKT